MQRLNSQDGSIVNLTYDGNGISFLGFLVRFGTLIESSSSFRWHLERQEAVSGRTTRGPASVKVA